MTRCQILTHGYGGYSNGCRCPICKDAKAAYVRDRRAAANALAAQVGHRSYLLVTDNITHGTRFAYEERGCRCEPCVTAKRAQWRSEHPRRHTGQGSAATRRTTLA